ncbi:MAG: methyltransferase, partial [Rhodobacteraceae bacterium]|nr:methyltransferase [Paracoccaceae bacterium]
QLMQTEYIYPTIADRTSPKEWEENNRPGLLDSAIRRKQEILSQTPTARLPPDLDARIRKDFRIHLPPT